jgi:hypothetical protein
VKRNFTRYRPTSGFIVAVLLSLCVSAFILINADKPSNVVYLEWTLRLSRSGTVIVVDNI